MVARRQHQPAGQGHDRQHQGMEEHDPRTHAVAGVADEGGEQHERQRGHPVPPVGARQHRPHDPGHPDLDEVLGQLGVADGEDVHRVRVLVVHGVEVGVQGPRGVEGAVHEVEVDVVQQHVEERGQDEVDGVEGPAAGEVGLEVEDVEGGRDCEGEGVDPGSAGDCQRRGWWLLGFRDGKKCA